MSDIANDHASDIASEVANDVADESPYGESPQPQPLKRRKGMKKAFRDGGLER